MNMYKKNLSKRKQTLTRFEYDEIIAQAARAKDLLESEVWKFNKQYFETSLQEIETLILNNRVRDVQEVATVSDTLKNIFFTPKKVQLDELSGQYKWIKSYLSWLELQVDRADRMRKEVDDGRLIIT